MRLFGGDRVQSLMNALKIDEDQPIETRMLTNTIEGAQKKVEAKNFNIRKNVLQFDDVMNRQREIIYQQRDMVLDGKDVHGYIMDMLRDMLTETVAHYLPERSIHDDWNIEGLRDYYMGFLTTEDDFHYSANELAEIDAKDIVEILYQRGVEKYAEREAMIGAERMRELERVILLKVVDRYWMEHIDNMDELKKGIYLRSYGQKNPVVEYKMEGFEMFDEMVAAIREDTIKMLMTFKIEVNSQIRREQVAKPTAASHGDEPVEKRKVRQPVHKPKIGRNDQCPCGSGKKYKNCCGANEEVTPKDQV